MIRFVGKYILPLFLSISTLSAVPTVQLQVSDWQMKPIEKVTIGSSVQITIRMQDTQQLPSCEPQLPAMAGAVTPRGVQTTISTINGQQEIVRQWQYELVPETLGTMLIGPAQLRCGGNVYQTNAAKIIVVPATSAKSASSQQTTTDIHEELRGYWQMPEGPYIAGQVLPVTLVIESLHAGTQVELEAIQLPVSVVQQTPSTVTTLLQHGRQITRVTCSYILQLPLQGTVQLPRVTARVQYLRLQSIFGWFQAQTPTQEEITIAPKLLMLHHVPQGRAVSYIGRVDDYAVSASAQKITMLQAVNVTATVRGTGVPHQPLFTHWPDQVKVYEGNKKIRYQEDTGEYTTTLEWIVQPQGAGSIQIPATAWMSYDPMVQKFSQHTSPALTIEVEKEPVKVQQETITPLVHAENGWLAHMVDKLYQSMQEPFSAENVLFLLLLPLWSLIGFYLWKSINYMAYLVRYFYSTVSLWYAVNKAIRSHATSSVLWDAWRMYIVHFVASSQRTQTAEELIQLFNPYVPSRYHEAWNNYLRALEYAVWSSQPTVHSNHALWIASLAPWRIMWWRLVKILRSIKNSLLQLIVLWVICSRCSNMYALDAQDIAHIYPQWAWPANAQLLAKVSQIAAPALAQWHEQADFLLRLRHYMVQYLPWSYWQLLAVVLSIVGTFFLFRAFIRSWFLLWLPWWLIVGGIVGMSEYQKLRRYAIVTQSPAAQVHIASTEDAPVVYTLATYSVVTCTETVRGWCRVITKQGTGMIDQRNLTQL